MTANKSLNKELSQKRMREILTVLKKHQLTKGITPKKLREVFEDLGPTYIKLGQIMSMRSDIFPDNYCKEFIKLRTDVKPLPYTIIQQVIEQELKHPIKTIFKSISQQPLGSASIAQVHAATLISGEKVVIKIQRPAIKEIMKNDIALMKKAANILKIAIGTGDLLDFNMILDELWKTSQEEMDFIKEAKHLKLFFQNQQKIQYITCPIVYEKYTTPQLLVMSYIDGIRIDEIEKLKAMGYNMTEIGQKIAENYCKQILEDGFFHADPHPGNIWIDKGKIAWLDLGMTGVLSDFYKSIFKKAISAILKDNIYELKDALLSLGEARGEIDHTKLYEDLNNIVNHYIKIDLGSMNLGKLIEDLLNLLKKHKIAISSDITPLSRSMVTMQGTLSICSPKVNMIQIFANHMSTILIKELDLQKIIYHNLYNIYTSSQKCLDIPVQLSNLLDIAKNGQLKINMESSTTKAKQNLFWQLGNHLSFAIIISSLFISSSILCFSNIQPFILSLPWPAFIGFFTAALILIWLLITTIKRK